jgi:hypothetical protein
MRTVTQFEKDEDKFLYNQLKQKALIRLNEGRGEPIDWLILIYLHALKLARTSRGLSEADAPGGRDGALMGDGSEVPLTPLPPSTMPPGDVVQFVVQSALATAAANSGGAGGSSNNSGNNNRSIRYANTNNTSAAALAALAAAGDPKVQLNKLRDNVRLFMDLEESQQRAQHSHAVVVNDYWFSLLTLVDDKLAELGRTSDEGTLHAALISEIGALFADKNYEELVETEVEMKAQLDAQGSGDVAIDEEHFHTILKHLSVCKARARLLQVYSSVMSVVHTSSNGSPADTNAGISSATSNGSSAPPSSSSPSTVGGVGGGGVVRLSDEDWFQREVARGLDENEEAFNQEVSLPARSGSQHRHRQHQHNDDDSSDASSLMSGPSSEWPEKYRPRKPRYFNRVKTGYEWNKYNQTHYDSDTPPPKIVQGYKFTLFYPDLIDKTQTPRFTIQKTESPDFVYVRFSAGPPYEDVAFKIVNREWENSHKKGFKSQFSNGILYLWFNFKRYRYRR